MASRYVKGLLKVKKPPKPKKRYPTTDAAKKPVGSLRAARTSDPFLARRGVLGGAQEALKKAPKVKDYASGLREGMVTGSLATAATALYLKNKKARKEAQAKDDKKLKKAMEQHKKKTEAKRKKYGKHHG